MRRSAGFTLVELLVLLAVLGLLVALVGPLTADRLDKTRAQEEWLILERTVTGLAFRAFAEGREVELHAEGTRLTWMLGGDEQRVLDLERIFFDPSQTIRISTNGLALPGELRLSLAGRPRSLQLNRWLEDDK